MPCALVLGGCVKDAARKAGLQIIFPGQDLRRLFCTVQIILYDEEIILHCEHILFSKEYFAL